MSFAGAFGIPPAQEEYHQQPATPLASSFSSCSFASSMSGSFAPPPRPHPAPLPPPLATVERQNVPQPSSSFKDQRAARPKIANHELGADDFEIHGECGRGASSVVFSATHRTTGQRVALKQLPRSHFQSDAARAMLRREINFHRQLRNPHVVRLLSYFKTSEHVVLVLERCDGTLRDHLDRTELSEAEAGDILRQIATGLQAVHEAGCVHRDIKLENVLVKGRTVKIADFGCAQAVSEGRNTCVGTLDYVPPEVLSRDAHTVMCDVWALGVLACELFGSCPPFFREGRAATLAAIREADPILPDGISPDTACLIRAMLSKVPSDRPNLDDVIHSEFCTTPARRRNSSIW